MSVLSLFAQSEAYYYNEDVTASGTDAAAVAAVSLVFFGVLIVVVLIAYAVMAFLLGRIFKKAGVEQWIAWVPFYNNWKLLELGGQQGFWSVLALVPVVNIVAAIFMYIAMYYVGKKLQKDDWFVVLAIFLPIVWYIWLAFDDSKWDEKVTAEQTKHITPEETK